MTYRTIFAMMLALRQLRQRERWSRPQLDTYQAQALHDLRAYAYAHSPFYRQFHAGLADRPLHELPVLTKAMLQAHMADIVTDRAIRPADVAAHVAQMRGAERFLGRYFVTATSGTTGEPAYLLYNQREWATMLASFTRYERHVGSLWGLIQRPRMAVVASTTPWHMSARVGATVRSSVLPMLRLDVGAPVEQLVQRLNQWQPQLLATYASMAGILADEQQAGRLQIHPRRIVSTAEVLTPELRTRVEAAWGQGSLFNQYGASEGGAYAVECGAHGGLHLFEDLVIFEVVDETNRPVPPGEFGAKVLLTVLYNRTQPLIRYELTDSVRLSTRPSCPCGCAFRLIDHIQGRQEEVLRFPTATGGTTSVHPMVFYRILDAAPVAGWQVAHTADGLCLRLSGAPGAVDEPQLVASVRTALAQQNAAPLPITVQWRAVVPRGATGKAARIFRLDR